MSRARECICSELIELMFDWQLFGASPRWGVGSETD